MGTVGGKRENAGRKSTWRSPTKMIRLPEQYELEIIDYARRLDSESESKPVLNSDLPDPALAWSLELEAAITTTLLQIPPTKRAEANKLFKKLRQNIGQSKV